MKRFILIILPVLFSFFFIFLHLEKVYAQTCTNTPTSSNTLSSTFSVPEDNTYTIWTRLIAPDTNNNAIYLQIDGGCAITVGDSSTIPANQFTWVNYQDGTPANQVLVTLPAGTHTLKFTEKEGGIGIDRVLITTNTSCVPEGMGDNCPLPTATPVVFSTPTASPAAATNTPIPPTSTPVLTSTPIPTPLPTNRPVPTATLTPTPASDSIRPSVGITAPANSSVVARGKAFTISANATDNVAVRQVHFSVTGKGGNASCTDTTAPYTCSWLVPSKPSTSYTITVTATDTSGNTNTAASLVTSSK